MRVLAIGAHPDDLEILCAGTLAKYHERGDTVIMCHAARGDKGHYIISPEELARIRRQEAIASAQVIGAEAIEMKFDDLEIPDVADSLLRFVEMLRATRPNVVITHHPDDYHTDHKAVSKLTLDAIFAATVPHIPTTHEHLTQMPPIYFMDTLAGVNFQPSDYVDITPYLQTKIAMMREHQSQLTWLKEHDGFDVLDAIETAAKYRGYQCGVPYAEGFIRYRVWGRNQPGSYLP